MLGHGFRKGDVPSGSPLRLSEANGRVVVKRRWNDGSVKHAIIVGRTDLAANTPKTISIVIGTPAAGTDLTAASIQSAAPNASVQCGSIGTVNLSSLLGAPFRTWMSTPEMVECHYRSAVGSDPNLSVWFYVRLWAGGRMWVRAIVENGYLNQTPGTKSYAATVTIGGAGVVNGQSVSHHAFTRWTAEGWIGGDPGITPMHNPAYLISTRLVPNYWKRSPSSAALNGLRQTYAPMQLAPNTATMGDGGFGDYIGVLPNQSALYVTSGDQRAYRAALTGSSAFNTYSIYRKSSATNRTPRPSDFPSTAIDGGTFNLGNPTAIWELNHLVNEGYVAYLISGDYWHYETLAGNASICYLCISTGNGTGVNKILRAETRGVAWMLNTVGHFCAIAPNENEATADAAIVSDYQTLLANNATYWAGQTGVVGMNPLGSLYQFSLGAWSGTGSVAPWMTDFWVIVNGQISRMEPIASMTNWNVMRDWMYRWVVGRLGTGGASNWHFSRAGSEYGISISALNNTAPSSFFTSWGQCWTATYGSANGESANTLAGTRGSSSDPVRAAVNHRWGVLISAISYAVEDRASGADAAWARLTGASNWAALEAGDAAPANFNDTPIWGIVPRGFGGT